MRQKTTYKYYLTNGKHLLLLLLLLLTGVKVSAQIQIRGSVYGGGKEGNVGGNTTITLRAGDLNKVFGGAQMADIDGRSFVHIDGAHASDYMLINYVYGGNDMSGIIGKKTGKSGQVATKPTELEKATENGIDNSWDAYVRISNSTKKIYIGQLFAGGNGDYDYTSVEDYVAPNLKKTYLEILGGSIVYAFGGGNNATVSEKTIIHVENPSTVVNSIKDTRITTENDGELLTQDRINQMGYNPGYTFPTSAAYQIGSFFGGNNRAAMAIRPTWNLLEGKIRNLYSGGNEGDMTSTEGLLVEIPEQSKLEVGNIYGGCRKADVIPGGNKNQPEEVLNLAEVDAQGKPKYYFPDGFSARVLVRGGHVTNVYGGNDISGKVYGGNAVGIYTTIYGDVYGGGNGSYPYTDNADLANDPTFGDLYYGDPQHPFSTEDNGLESVTALNNFRPNAEQVSIRIAGTSASKKTIIHGSVYLGGNSATLSTTKSKPKVELKIGSYAIIDNVFLGNNGEDMISAGQGNISEYVHEGLLRTYKRTLKQLSEKGLTPRTYSTTGKFSQMDLTKANVFEKYMEGCAMTLMPSVVFDNTVNKDPATYIKYTTSIGSFFCGGNVGSMIIPNKTTINFEHHVIIYRKLVGGCNNAYVPLQYAADNERLQLNAAFFGGLIGSSSERDSYKDTDGKIKDRLELNLDGLKIQPKRWNAANTELIWNTIYASTRAETTPVTSGATEANPVMSNKYDLDRRFDGGNIYGGCFNSGLVNGNVVINIKSPIVDLKPGNDGDFAIFDKVKEDEEGEAKLNDNDEYTITLRRSGVIRDEQGMDVLGSALNVFGGGYGKNSEIKGGTTINLTKGYAFQVFGGGEMGAVGVHSGVDSNGNYTYTYNDDYSTCINLNGPANLPGVPKDASGDHPDMAEAEFIYGGGFEGMVAGNTVINLNNGRVFDTFAGSCNADILGHTETYIGRNGFPYIRDDVYGGNDLGGRIHGNSEKSFKARVRDDDSDAENGNGNLEKVYGYSSSTKDAEVLTASAYIEYTKGRVDTIFGGCYGYYNYKKPYFEKYTYTEGGTGTTTDNMGMPRPGFTKPRLNNAFVNFRPEISSNQYNKVLKIYGAGQGFPGEKGKDSLQNRSYVLIDIPQEMTTFQEMEVFGAGAYSGLGMGVMPSVLIDHEDSDNQPVAGEPDKASAVIDLLRGRIKDVFGASYKEGVTRRTMVNVPAGSTINVNRIFGGGYGISNDVPCDAYETNVNYNSSNAVTSGNPEDVDDKGNQLAGGIYGGNNNYRRTLYAKVNIGAPVYNGVVKDGNRYTARIFGAGYGKDTWAQYTEVNLQNGANVYEVYGGGYGGMVLNKQSVDAWSSVDKTLYTTIGAGYTDNGLDNQLALMNQLGKEKTNTNVNIEQGAWVGNYAYGGGLGVDAVVSGKTYIGLHGGGVNKDLYAAGTSGAVMDKFKQKNFTATTYAYVKGGTARNVFGGGWEGSVGYHKGELEDIATNADPDILGETYVVIGVREDQPDAPASLNFMNGKPAIQRNVYGGGEGGAVYGTTHMAVNNGYIGYEHFNSTSEFVHTDLRYIEDGTDVYQEKFHDETFSDEKHPVGSPNFKLEDYGNVYGGGFDDNSNVDHSEVTVWGGVIRNSVYGGGEIATIGRGSTKEEGAKRTLNDIYEPGSTHVEMYNGHVHRDVYGGGKGFNVEGYGHNANKEKRYTDGYVFGNTEVYIYGGEIGTTYGLADGYGNVFGGGNVGYVYSPSYLSNVTKTEKTNHPTGSVGCSPNHWYYYDKNGIWTEDCKVVVSPRLQIRKNGTSVTYPETGEESVTYHPYDYVPTDYLNTLPVDKSDTGWTNLYTGDKITVNNEVVTNLDDPVERGIMIHNAVFAGGNVSSNSDQTYANATTVYGNTTATLYDVYHRDFITVGTEHTGGLYGGGNLSVVDGYRELNITNYGTDFYRLDTRIDIETYRKLSNRERAYFKLQYACKEGVTITVDGETYTSAHKPIDEDDYLKMLERHTEETDPKRSDIEAAFEMYGFCSIYAGRLLNTIQRADFCGVFGSRLVLQGAKDRVADVGDATAYTINRVGELSLNLQHSSIAADADDPKEKLHGNYFGIYSVVNRLGNLTSDVRFKEHYYRDTNGDEDTSQSYYKYKADNPTSANRNKGQSYNQVALASGVFLEMTTEESTADHKVYGYITGVVELDLINVKRDDVGGGFVYAKNQHGEQTYNESLENKILSQYNKLIGNGACTYKQYSYDNSADKLKTFQTSGNFIHHEKTIVDDCYPTNNAYKPGDNFSEAHYWYVKGDVYIYDVTVSAYTGSANAYMKEVKIPLTITAASHGKLKLMDVKPSLYAYQALDNDGNPLKIGTKVGEKVYDKAFVNSESDSYELNDVITWWDWHNLKTSERNLFRKHTYVNCVTCKIDGKEYEAGTYVMDEEDFTTFKASEHTFKDADDKMLVDRNNNPATIDYVFRSSNNISHDTGYVLTFDMNTPKIWDDWYSPISRTSADSYFDSLTDTNRAQTDVEGNAPADKIAGPTYKTNTAGVYGKRHYNTGEIITADTYTNYKNQAGLSDTEKGYMQKAYVATDNVIYNSKAYNKGTAISETEYKGLDATTKEVFDEAFVCINTVKLDDANYLLLNDLLTQDQIDELTGTETITGKYPSKKSEITGAFTPAYIITHEGEFGGQTYDAVTNYDAIKGWSSLSSTDRRNFTFNYDAFDVLSDPNFMNFYLSANDDTGNKYPHNSSIEDAYKAPYCNQVDVEYEAVFQADAYGADHKDGNNQPIKSLSYDNGTTVIASEAKPRISNTIFETQVKNDQRHYTRVDIKTADEVVYIANQIFDYEGVPYGKGQVIEDEDVYNNNKAKVDAVTFANTGVQYYCYEDYTNASGASVSKGVSLHPVTLDQNAYGNLTNDQKYFIIQGKEPTGVTTLYVSSESDILDVTKEKIITVVYQYTYYENEDNGNIKQTNELHVVNIHLELESGAPNIGPLNPPATVLPGYTVGLNSPTVDPGLYLPIGNGWEIFTNETDATHHRNGLPFDNGKTPVYWYQNEKVWVAFYSKNYLGKTYSNPVVIKVANYHDLDDVMRDKEHHMYVDHVGAVRNPKIYIDNRDCVSDPTKNELDLLKDFFDLSLQTEATGGHATLDSHVKGLADLDFILSSNMSPKAYANDWTSIGNDSQCFGGTLHGDGYTISGLNNSLFGKLCGKVYNLGVTGSFTSAGIADSGSGSVENCWINTTGTPNSTVKAVFGTGDADHVVNCYYEDKTNNYATGPARAMTDAEFHNGTVAYNLNGFYLNKRYYDKMQGSSDNSYNYLENDPSTGQLKETMSMGYYPTDYKNYVEERYNNPDFIYAGGTIPETVESRLRTVTTGTEPNTVTTTYYAPIWPDDYLFFGQMLTYKYDLLHPHERRPSHIVKTGGRLPTDANTNRVSRAPAYFGDNNMGTFHFNPACIIAAYPKRNSDLDPLEHAAYAGMTAVDFAGYNDTDYKLGWNNDFFCQPLLDDWGLLRIENAGVTHNLVVYAPSSANNEATYDVLNGYFKEPEYNEYEINDDYGSIDKAPTDMIFGHLVQATKTNGKPTATNDHLLVDKQEFNCPIAYTMDNNSRLWYQRVPDKCVTIENGNTKGWETICLPFKVALVSTHQKGEITHFYGTSRTGHEYWLREYKGGAVSTENTNIFNAIFNPLEATGEDKTYDNRFLWDYYYSLNNNNTTGAGDDANGEVYKEYYNKSHIFESYPLQQAGTPYLIGFPGRSYYEFDLSGEWIASNTASPAPAKLEQQTITFASDKGVSVAVTSGEEGEINTHKVKENGYAYIPNYKNLTLETAYVLASDGGSFVKNTAGATVDAFRPYIVEAAVANSRGDKAQDVERVVFGNDYPVNLLPKEDPTEKWNGEGLIIFGKKDKIIVKSQLEDSADVRIISLAGITLDSFTIEPGETIETRMDHASVYIVNAANGRYVKKVAIR